MFNVHSRIKLKKDTLEHWNQNPNYVLYDGEIGIVQFTDNSYGIKIGDGTSKFSELDYLILASAKSKNLSVGDIISNSGTGTTVLGDHLNNSGQYSIVAGTSAQSSQNWTFTWNGDPTKINNKYASHGAGTFNINPDGGVDNFYIGEQRITDIFVRQINSGTITTNNFERAQGRYNASHTSENPYPSGSNTIHSIGVGTSTSDRKNAIEVMQNGDVYVKGIGDYVGTSITDKEDLATVINSSIQRISAIETQLSGLETALHIINTGLDPNGQDISSIGLDVNSGYELVNLDALYCDINGNPSSWSYGTSETAFVKYCVQNHAVNRIVLNSSEYPVTIELPEIEDGYARDYIIRLEVVMQGTIPQITFQFADENATFESTDDWQDIEKGVNIISFTETFRNYFPTSS